MSARSTSGAVDSVSQSAVVRWQNKKRDEGLCITCGREKLAPTSDHYCRECLDKIRQRTDKYSTQIRIQALEAYGRICRCCNESNEIFLELDHINNDGGTHRKTLGTRGGFGFYLKMRKQGWPPGLQVLCANCHLAKSRGGCPHERNDLA